MQYQLQLGSFDDKHIFRYTSFFDVWLKSLTINEYERVAQTFPFALHSISFSLNEQPFSLEPIQEKHLRLSAKKAIKEM